eukprot:1431791-Prymnesium_polylepis.1
MTGRTVTGIVTGDGSGEWLALPIPMAECSTGAGPPGVSVRFPAGGRRGHVDDGDLAVDQPGCRCGG